RADDLFGVVGGGVAGASAGLGLVGAPVVDVERAIATLEPLRRDGMPNPADIAMLLQIVVGAWPLDLALADAAGRDEFARRLAAWQEKALREAKLIGANERIRLPSEAEWEYCCRAGTTTAWSFGDDVRDLGKYSWFKDNSAGEDPPVGKKLPNAWGLYDMHGYVWEWCLDAWHPDYKNAPADGSARAKTDSHDRVLRGGAYPDPADKHRSAYRHHGDPNTRTGAIGFRCVKDKLK
ncbi:MAG: SUMF1/EgtB/PvdO family nonheme iron enzyme, partial [Planctomycetes bacterium]|nr:SUMF1/EgtB/PvdO family nonheme iron enzyme [Planctomycetota bacterium]